jgi:hypothetical protein
MFGGLILEARRKRRSPWHVSLEPQGQVVVAGLDIKMLSGHGVAEITIDQTHHVYRQSTQPSNLEGTLEGSIGMRQIQQHPCVDNEAVSREALHSVFTG